MPVTKTAKRALRSSDRKRELNKSVTTALSLAERIVRRDKSKKALENLFSVADKAAKRKVIHQKKADRIKRRISKIVVAK